MPTEIERLYREHRAGLVRLVERELHDHHDAEDVVQTAFLDAQRALERGTIPRNPPAWLATIALNAGRRFRRRRLIAAPLEEYAVHEASGSEIRAALASLPSEQRAAVMYRDVLGYSYGETAEQMGRSVNAVTMLLHRGRKRLRQTLAVTTGGPWLWRWSRHTGTAQMAVVKGGAAVIAATGLATAGIVAAHAVAPIGANVPVAVTTGSLRLTTGAGQTPGGTPAQDSAVRHVKATHGSRAGTTPAPTTNAVSPSQSASTPRTPPVPLSGVPIPTLPATVAATVSVTTPVTTAAVTTPTGLTVTTPVTTVTVALP